MQHQFNLGSAIQPPPFIPKHDPDAPLLASVEGVATALSNEEAMFQLRGTTRSRVMTQQVLLLLAECRPFRSVDEHIAHALRTVPGLRDAVQARQAIEALQRNGLLQTDAEFLQGLATSDVETTPAPFAGLCIRACDRPAQVERLLASLAAYEGRFGAKRAVRLVDDSRDRANAVRNQRLLEAHAKATGATVQYIAADAGARVAKRLDEALPQHTDAARALLVQSPDTAAGRPWNLLLLATAGSRLAMLDEDFEFPLRRHPAAHAGLDPHGGDGVGVTFYGTLAEVLAAGEDLDRDPIEQHLALLGGSLASVLAKPDLALDRQTLRGMTLADLNLLGDADRVVNTLVGTRGASCTSTSAWLFELDAASRADFWRTRDDYLHNLEGQSIWFGYTQARATERGYFTPFGLDNSILAPCTTPTARRGEDQLFNTLQHFCQPRSIALHLPQSIGHVQESARRRSVGLFDAPTPDYTAFLGAQLDNCDFGVRAVDPARRLHYAAAVLENIAAGSDAALAAHLREYLNYHRGGIIERLHEQLTGQRDAPVYWQADLRKLIESTAKAMVVDVPPRLAGWPETLDDAGCAQRLRKELRDTARALRAWPELWAWARDHNDELQRLL